MATFEQRDSGWWQAKVRRKGFPSQSQTFEKLDDAEKWARDVENKMDRGVFVDREEAETTSLLKALERYDLEKSQKKDGRDQEEYRIKAWMRDPLAARSLASLRGVDFAKWRDRLLNCV